MSEIRVAREIICNARFAFCISNIASDGVVIRNLPIDMEGNVLELDEYEDKLTFDSFEESDHDKLEPGIEGVIDELSVDYGEGQEGITLLSIRPHIIPGMFPDIVIEWCSVAAKSP